MLSNPFSEYSSGMWVYISKGESAEQCILVGNGTRLVKKQVGGHECAC